MKAPLESELRKTLESAKIQRGITNKSLQRSGIRFPDACTRISTLRVMGYLRDSGQRRAGAILYKLTEAGEKALSGEGMIS